MPTPAEPQHTQEGRKKGSVSYGEDYDKTTPKVSRSRTWDVISHVQTGEKMMKNQLGALGAVGALGANGARAVRSRGGDAIVYRGALANGSIRDPGDSLANFETGLQRRTNAS